MLKVEGVGGSGHLPVFITLRSELQLGSRAEVVFLPFIRRLQGRRIDQVKEAYSRSLPLIAEKFSEVDSVSVFHGRVRRVLGPYTSPAW